jgi:hypothetical protein
VNKEKVFNPTGIDRYGDYRDLLSPMDFAGPPGKVQSPEELIEYFSIQDQRMLKFGLIVVPQGRSAEHILPAAQLAHESQTPLLTLCSHDANATDVARVLSTMHNAPTYWCAVDVPPGYRLPDVELTADQAIPEQCRKNEDWNLSDKRNIGLVLGEKTRAQQIFFIDDDVKKISKAALRRAEAALFLRQVVGFGCKGFPDKSVIMHAKEDILEFHHAPAQYRSSLKAGSLSGNSSGVSLEHGTPYFPRGIYNEDWIFMSHAVATERAVMIPEYYYQDEYNPYDAKRAQQEEFGDLVADGIYGLMKIDGNNLDLLGQPEYWQSVIGARRTQYELLLKAIKARRNPVYLGDLFSDEEKNALMSVEAQNRLSIPLMAGMAINETLKANDFITYLHAWGEDSKRWRYMFEKLKFSNALWGRDRFERGVKNPYDRRPIKEALGDLSLTSYATNM